MNTICRLIVVMGMAACVLGVQIPEALAGAGGDPVDVAVFELQGEGIDDDLLQTLSGVLRQEAQQHDRYALANPAAVRRDEIALVVGCDPSETSCLREMGEYVDGQVLIFGDVVDRGDELMIAVEILDVRGDEEPVQVRRRLDDVRDPVVAFRREVEEIFAGLISIEETHLVVVAPADEVPIRLDGVVVGEGTVERQGLQPGTYHVAVGEGDQKLWDDEVELVPGQLVEIRPEPVDSEDDDDDLEMAGQVAEMDVEERRVVPGDDPMAASHIRYEGRRSNLGAFSLMGTGATALLGSTVMAVLMRRTESKIATESEEGTLDAARHESLISRGENYQTAHYVLFGVGVAGLAVGGGWAAWNIVRDRSERSDLDGGVSLHPTARGIAISGRW